MNFDVRQYLNGFLMDLSVLCIINIHELLHSVKKVEDVNHSEHLCAAPSDSGRTEIHKESAAFRIGGAIYDLQAGLCLGERK
jgi:hypothetical protein